MNTSRISRAVASLALVSALLVACSSSPKPAQTDTAGTGTSLVVPKSFSSPDEKRDFALKAVDDGYYADAAPLLESIVAESPNAAAYAQLGTARYNMKDHAGAVEAWEKAGELDPAMLAVMKNNAGNALRDARRTAEAEAMYKEALALDPTHWVTAINLATLYRFNGQLDEAIKVLEASATVNTDANSVKDLLSALKSKLDQGT